VDAPKTNKKNDKNENCPNELEKITFGRHDLRNARYGNCFEIFDGFGFDCRPLSFIDSYYLKRYSDKICLLFEYLKLIEVIYNPVKSE